MKNIIIGLVNNRQRSNNKELRRKSTSSTVSFTIDAALDKAALLAKESDANTSFDFDNQISKIVSDLDSSEKSDSPTGTMETTLSEITVEVDAVPPPPLTEDTEEPGSLLVDFPNRSPLSYRSSSASKEALTSSFTTSTKKTKNCSVHFKEKAQVTRVESYASSTSLKKRLWYNEIDLTSFQRDKGQSISMIRMLQRFSNKNRMCNNAEYAAQQKLAQVQTTEFGLENHIGTIPDGISWTQMNILREQHRKAVLIEQWRQIGEHSVQCVESIAKVSRDESEWARTRSVEIGKVHANYDKDDKDENDDDDDEGSIGVDSLEDAEERRSSFAAMKADEEAIIRAAADHNISSHRLLSRIDEFRASKSRVKLGSARKLLAAQGSSSTSLAAVSENKTVVTTDTSSAESTRSELDNLRASKSRVKAGSARNLLRESSSKNLSSRSLGPSKRPPQVPHNTPTTSGDQDEDKEGDNDITPEQIRTLRQSIKLKMERHTQSVVLPQDLSHIDWSSSCSDGTCDDTSKAGSTGGASIVAGEGCPELSIRRPVPPSA